MFDKEQLSRKIYYSPKTRFQGADKLYEKAHEIDSGIGRKDVAEFLKQQETYQLHKEVHKKKEYLRTFVGHLGEKIQIDLIDMRKYSTHNEGYNWIVAMIDIFFRYAFTITVKGKSGKVVLEGFEELMKEFHIILGEHPKRCKADEGGEFFNNAFKKYMNEHSIEFFASKSVRKASTCIVERFNKTLKNIMWKFMDHKRDKNWEQYLAHFTYNYNHSRHSTIKMRPSDVSRKNEREVFENLYGSWTEKVVPPKFEIMIRSELADTNPPLPKGTKCRFTTKYTQFIKSIPARPRCIS